MEKEELEKIVKKYRSLSNKLDQQQEDEKSHQYERFAEWVEENIDSFEDTEDKKELWNTFIEENDEDTDWMFPNREDE